MADVGDGASVGHAGGAADPRDSGLTDQYEDLFQIALDRLVESAGNMAGVIQARPALTLGLLAGGTGAIIGLRLATRRRSSRERLGRALETKARTVEKGARRAREGGKWLRRAADYSELLQLGMKLLNNPIVRALLVETVTKRITRRFK